MRLLGRDAIEYKRYYGDTVTLRKLGDPRGGPNKDVSLAAVKDIDPSLLYSDTVEEVEVIFDWENNPEDKNRQWWDAVQSAVDNEPYLFSLMLAEGGPDRIRCSAKQAVEIKKWAAAVPGWASETAPEHAPHPLVCRDLPRYRVEKILAKKGWATAKEMAENSGGLLTPEQAREALRNLNVRKMTLDTLIRLCKTLGVSMNDLFGTSYRWY